MAYIPFVETRDATSRGNEMVKAIVAVVVFAAYRVRIACTRSNAERFRLACELDRRLAKL